MNDDAALLNPNSPGWMMFVRSCFGISIAAMGVAIFFLPVTVWIKGYIAMGALLMLASTFMLSKTMRDEFEAKKISHRLNEVRAEKLLREIDPA